MFYTSNLFRIGMQAHSITQIFFTILIIAHFINLSNTVACATDNELILYVGGTGPGNYSQIQPAINNAKAETTIYIFSGVYNENIILNKSLIILGENASTTIINGNRKDSVITLLTDKNKISNLTIYNGKKIFPKAGVSIQSDHNIIENLTIYDNYYGIVLVDYAYHNIIADNYIHNNHQCGIYFSEAKHNLITRNYVSTQPFNGFGLYDFSDNNILSYNLIINNKGYGINIRDSYNNQILGNMISNNSQAIHIPPPQFLTKVENNVLTNNELLVEEEKGATYYALPVFSVVILIMYTVVRKKL